MDQKQGANVEKFNVLGDSPLENDDIRQAVLAETLANFREIRDAIEGLKHGDVIENNIVVLREGDDVAENDNGVFEQAKQHVISRIQQNPDMFSLRNISDFEIVQNVLLQEYDGYIASFSKAFGAQQDAGAESLSVSLHAQMDEENAQGALHLSTLERIRNAVADLKHGDVIGNAFVHERDGVSPPVTQSEVLAAKALVRYFSGEAGFADLESFKAAKRFSIRELGKLIEDEQEIVQQDRIAYPELAGITVGASSFDADS